MPRPGTEEGLSSKMDAALEERLAKLKVQIASRAQQIAGDQIQPDLEDISRAFGEATKGESKNGFFDLFSPFTLVCAVLCLAFGALSFVRSVQSSSAAFLDIAKIFAGAIVGSTTTSALTRVRRAR